MFIVILCGADAAGDRTAQRFEAVLQLKFPTQSKIVGIHRDIAGFDGSKSWLVELDLNTPRGWESSPQFDECPSNETRGADYEFISGIVWNEFPEMKSRFLRPRIWRGGREGNCYIVASDDGRLTWFHYFRT